MSKLISLTKSKFAIVDDEDFERLNRYKWFYSADAIRDIRVKVNKQVKLRMQYEVLHIIPFVLSDRGMCIDHINGNKLDNRKCNLRVVTKAQNNANQNRIHGAVPYKGVSYRKDRKKYSADIMCHKVKHHLGLYALAQDAADAYDAAALKYFGEYAKTNKEIKGL